jgi:fatty acid desaturase
LVASELLIAVDLVLAGMSLIAGFYAYRVFRLFRKDAMQRMFAIITVAFLLVCFAGTYGAATELLGFYPDFPYVSVTDIITTALIIVGLVSLLGWKAHPD